MTTAPCPPTDTERTDARALTLPLVAAQVAQNIAGGLLLGKRRRRAHGLAGPTSPRHGVGRWHRLAHRGSSRCAFADEFRADRRWRQRELEHRRDGGGGRGDAHPKWTVALSDEIEAERNALRRA